MKTFPVRALLVADRLATSTIEVEIKFAPDAHGALPSPEILTMALSLDMARGLASQLPQVIENLEYRLVAMRAEIDKHR